MSRITVVFFENGIFLSKKNTRPSWFFKQKIISEISGFFMRMYRLTVLFSFVPSVSGILSDLYNTVATKLFKYWNEYLLYYTCTMLLNIFYWEIWFKISTFLWFFLHVKQCFSMPKKSQNSKNCISLIAKNFLREKATTFLCFFLKAKNISKILVGSGETCRYSLLSSFTRTT